MDVVTKYQHGVVSTYHLQLAADTGIRALWIADHDMIRDLPRTRQIQAVARANGVDVGFAVEITVCGT